MGGSFQDPKREALATLRDTTAKATKEREVLFLVAFARLSRSHAA
jgi:hypothetical protein